MYFTDIDPAIRLFTKLYLATRANRDKERGQIIGEDVFCGGLHSAIKHHQPEAAIHILSGLGFEDTNSPLVARQVRERSPDQTQHPDGETIATEVGRLSRLVVPTPEHWSGEGTIELTMLGWYGYILTINCPGGEVLNLLPIVVFRELVETLDSYLDDFALLSCDSEPGINSMLGRHATTRLQLLLRLKEIGA